MRTSLIHKLALSLSMLLTACGGNVETNGSAGSAGEGGGGSGGEGGGPSSTVSTTSSGVGGSENTTTSSTGGVGGDTSAGGTTTGGGPGDCPLLSVVTLSDPTFQDNGGDGKWSPGETATVYVTMTNTSSEDVQYPGITWFSDNPLVSAGNPYNAFFLLFAGQSMPIDIGFSADPATPPGTKVTLTAKLTDIQANICEELPQVTLDVVIE